TGCVGASARLRDRKRTQPTFRDTRQKAGLLLFIAEIDQRFHAVEIGSIDDARRGAGLGNDLHYLKIDAIRHSGAAVRIRHEDGVEPTGVDRLDVLPWKTTIAVIALGIWRDYVPGNAA